MATAQFQIQGQELVRALEARGRHFLPASKARIPLSELEDPVTGDILFRLTDLPSRLHLAGDERLQLTEARILYKSAVLDALCSLLKRLQWRQFCTQLDRLARSDGSFVLVGRALDCLMVLLRAWRHVGPQGVRPSRDTCTAMSETFNR